MSLTHLIGQLATAAAEAEERIASLAGENAVLHGHNLALRSEAESLAAKLAAALAEIERLKAPPSPVAWAPGTALETGKSYRLPDDTAVNVVLDVPGVTIDGGNNVIAKGSRPAILVAADDCTVRGVRFHTDVNPDRSGRVGVQECIAVGTEAGTPTNPRRTTIVDCHLGRGDSFVKVFPDADGVLVKDCTTSADSRAESVYVGGGHNVTVENCDFTARYENTVRWSPHRGALATNARVVGSTVANTGSKAAVEFRHVVGALAEGNTLTAGPEHSCVGAGDKDVTGSDVGARDVVVRGNTLHVGRLTFHEGSDRITVENNTFHWPHRPENNAIGFNCLAGITKDVRVVGNTGFSPHDQKPMLGFARPRVPGGFGPPVKPQRLVDEGNVWKKGQ